MRIHPKNRIVYNNDHNIYINPYDLNFYDNIETLSFRIIPTVNIIYNKLINYIINYNINSKNKKYFDNYIKNLNKDVINFFNSDVDDVYKFKIGEVLYFNNDLKILLNTEILNSQYYPYS